MMIIIVVVTFFVANLLLLESLRSKNAPVLWGVIVPAAIYAVPLVALAVAMHIIVFYWNTENIFIAGALAIFFCMTVFGMIVYVVNVSDAIINRIRMERNGHLLDQVVKYGASTESILGLANEMEIRITTNEFGAWVNIPSKWYNNLEPYKFGRFLASLIRIAREGEERPEQQILERRIESIYSDLKDCGWLYRRIFLKGFTSRHSKVPDYKAWYVKMKIQRAVELKESRRKRLEEKARQSVGLATGE